MRRTALTLLLASAFVVAQPLKFTAGLEVPAVPCR